jgi:very-short-patch-repair endonuclease
MGIGRPGFLRPTPAIRALARKLRSEATPAERRLWRALRERLPLNGSHIRRQVPLGPYIVDFCTLGAMLVIEVDGHQHGEDEARRRDLFRDQVLAEMGFRVLRFSNREVMMDLDVVLETICSVVGQRSGFASSPGDA